MAKDLNDSIEKLRKESRILLARIDEDSKRVNAEVKKLYLQPLSVSNCHNYKNRNYHISKNYNPWKLRNDSSEVNAVLCPDYLHDNLKHSVTMPIPDMALEKLTLISKGPREQCLEITPKKHIKDCYCYSEANKIRLRSSRTYHKPLPFHHCRSQPILRSNCTDNDDKVTVTSPISCETFRRVQKIDYTPRSQFLRNVQNKICYLQGQGQGDCLPTCSRSSSCHKFIANTMAECKLIDQKEKSLVSLKVPANSIASEENKSVRGNVACTSSKGNQTPLRKHSTSTLRKTITSKQHIPARNAEPISKSPHSSKRTTPLHECDCPCCYRNKLEKAVNLTINKRDGKKNMPKYFEERYPKQVDEPIIDNTVDQEMEGLKKFREQNYFETHGSSHTLVSSRSSGSLQQYLLNERLFPEPVRRIHKQDLVVTMPPCATTQRKRIHYFPRYVVRQEKTTCNTSYRKKRGQSCPLTGHAIDLGVLKAKSPANSLALKYQKRAF